MIRKSGLRALPVLMSLLLLVGGCAPDYSPNTYVSAAAQKANKVDQGVIVGVRPVLISADPTLGAATGGAAGGIAGSEAGPGALGALGALTGSVTGSIAGSVVSHSTEDTTGFEYIVRKTDGELLSVTQQDPAPLQIGQHVLIIEGAQARIVIDYTVPLEDKSDKGGGKDKKPDGAKPQPGADASKEKPETPDADKVTATPLPPPAAPQAQPQANTVSASPVTPSPSSSASASPAPEAKPAPTGDAQPQPAGSGG